MFATKYKPTIQKSLFHKDIVNHIRKWIKMLETNSEYNLCLKQILFLHGPIGCAKSVTVECLFKGYNIIDIDLDNLSSSEKTNDVLNSIVDFNSLTLENTFTKKRNKQNIVFIDNIELCEKGLDTFIDSIHSLHNIPIILVCNNSKYKNVFCNYKNCTLIEFKKPSLLELNKLLSDINQSENLNLTKENNKELIEKSHYDIRQLFFLVEQWYLSNNNISFENFIKTVDIKNEDQDLNEKMSYLLDYTKTFDFNKSFSICITDPQVISSSIYQNYNFINVENKSDNIMLLNRYSDMLYNLSESTVFHNRIYENQCWDLYNEYSVFSSIIPSYHLKLNKDILKKDDFKHIHIVSFKDFSYNFINSYQEVKKICKTNLFCKKLNTNTNTNISIFDCICDVKSCFSIVKILVDCFNKINEYFDKNKKGKNTTKKEKIDLCNNITNDYKKFFDKLINFVYEYKLFEIDIDSLDIKKYKNEELLRENCNKVELRVLKRFLNIFTLDDSHKLFKSHIEISLQYKIFIMILNHLEKQSLENKLKIHNTTETMTRELSEIWNF
jgi:DNA polymerase III delta prime subunit